MEETTTAASGKISKNNWVIIWIAGLAGQLCWNIENQWFNTFVYAKVSPDPDIISWMVAVSAIVSTLSTFISGTGSDRLGRRKPFVVFGYIMWGVFTIIFGLTEFISSKVMVLAVMVVVSDAIMSFFGSLGNDAGFNPWTTDISDEHNRGGLGAVVAVQPVLATIVGSLIGGMIIAALGYIWFFVIMGSFVIGVGVYSYFFLKDSPDLKPSRDEKGYWHQFASAFNFKLLAKNRMLMLVLCIFAVFFISFNVYFPHITNFFIYGFDYYDEGSAGILLGVGLLIAVPMTLVASKFINKGKFVEVASVATALNILGLVILSLTKFATAKTATTITIIIGAIFVGGGYMVIYQTLMIWCKNLYPEEQRGQLEGVRLFFYVCIPMVLGPAIGNPVIKNLGKPISIEYPTGVQDGFAPSAELFAIAAIVALLTFVPIYFASREQQRMKKAVVETEE